MFKKKLLSILSVLLVLSFVLLALPSCNSTDEKVNSGTESEAATAGKDSEATEKETTADKESNDNTDNNQNNNENNDQNNDQNNNENNNENNDVNDDNTEDGSQTTDTKGFDESKVVLSFGAISDIHITARNDDSEAKFRAAVAQLRVQAKLHDADGLDAVAIAGDISEDGTDVQANKFASIVNDLALKNVMLTPGNHDIRSNAGQMFRDGTALGEDAFVNDVDKSMLSKGARHCVVNGSHFIFIEPTEYRNNVPYDATVLTWIDDTLADITTNDPDAYVFVFTHPMIYDTCYGSTLSGGNWYTTYLTETLAKYPQVVTFGGHLHFAINDERTIMQDSFTSLGCGSVRYLATERGFSNMSSATVPKDAHSVSSGLLVQVDADGNVRVTRMDFSNESTFKEPWELSAPDADNEHLKKYTKARSDTNQAPTLSGTPLLETLTSPSGALLGVNLKISVGSDDDMVHHYKVVIKDLDGNTETTLCFLSDFYRHSKVSDMAKELVYPLGITASGRYLIEVSAIDSWDAESGKISAEITLNSPTGDSSSLPAVYTDFEFSNGTITDTNGKFTVDLQGATMEKTTLTFAGTTKTVDAFRVKEQGQHATVRFKDYNKNTITQFYNSDTGFTIEALYVNFNPDAKHGIVCGTQMAGLGLAEDHGKPYFYTYAAGGNINANTKTAISNVELNHVICTGFYDAQTNKTYTAMYINGELVASGSADGKIKISTDANIATALCLGADIAPNGKGEDFMTSDFALADLKIYASALDYAQVGTAYQNAVDGFKS